MSETNGGRYCTSIVSVTGFRNTFDDNIVGTLPEDDPVITGVEIQYEIGDEINLNCTSGKGHPAPLLHWYINEQQTLFHSPVILRFIREKSMMTERDISNKELLDRLLNVVRAECTSVKNEIKTEIKNRKQ
nr:unnamed protein product [Callosobruchus chinensis]